MCDASIGMIYMKSDEICMETMNLFIDQISGSNFPTNFAMTVKGEAGEIDIFDTMPSDSWMTLCAREYCGKSL